MLCTTKTNEIIELGVISDKALKIKLAEVINKKKLEL